MLMQELTTLVKQLKRNASAPLTLDALNSSLELLDVIEGEWEAYSYYVGPKHREAWKDARESESFKTVDELTDETAQDITAEDWESMEQPTEFSGAVQITVDIAEDETANYLRYVEESVDGVEVEFYYTATADTQETEEPFQEFQDDEEMQELQQQQQQQQQCP